MTSNPTADRLLEPPLVLCSGSLGDAPLEAKWRAAAAAGFGWVSVYGAEYHDAVGRGVDCRVLLNSLGLRVAEVDGVANTLGSEERFDEALAIAVALDARSITVVETGRYDPDDAAQLADAAAAFARHCDCADEHGVLVHIEPFAWSHLGRVGDAAAVAAEAGRRNGGVLVDLWHLVRGPDQGLLPEFTDEFPAESILGLQLADTGPEPWPAVRDECMTDRRLPGEGHADLVAYIAALAAAGPVPPVGVEVFGRALAGLAPVAAARRCHAAAQATLGAAAQSGSFR